jgi:hypothetical protein
VTKEIGPREKAAREVREALYEANQARMRALTKAEKLLAGGLDDARLARSKRLLAEAEAKNAAPPRRRKTKK